MMEDVQFKDGHGKILYRAKENTDKDFVYQVKEQMIMECIDKDRAYPEEENQDKEGINKDLYPYQDDKDQYQTEDGVNKDGRRGRGIGVRVPRGLRGGRGEEEEKSRS